MLPRINPTKTSAWQELSVHFDTLKGTHMRELFRDDPERFRKFSLMSGSLLFDFSKNIITGNTIDLLLKLAEECKLREAMDATFRGDIVNATENRSVLHTALRNFSGEPVYSEGNDVMPGIKLVLEKMKRFTNDIHKGRRRGYTGRRIRYIVNIGIGGSDLGPQMVTEALKAYQVEGIETFFVSNIDGTHISEVLKKIEPERTLFIIASKTFTTQETMTNAHTAREWFLAKAKKEKHIAKHFVALSTNEKAVTDFGIDPDNMFVFWDWVGGRYSVWSAIGLPVCLSIGYKRFEEFLEGAYHSDIHFRDTPFRDNIPVIMALLGIWYTNFFGTTSETILPYDQYMHRFAAYFQQGNMESNGKRVDRNGDPVTYTTGPVVWGEPGTNGQHAFYQLLHQGTAMIPCDFIAPARSHNAVGDHHLKLLSNFFAQTEALMNGKTEQEVQAEMETAGMPAQEIARLLPFRVFPGNRPTNSFLLEMITPGSLGQLIALYEHKIFVQGIIWNIYSFDQWGVELGKQLAGKILPEMQKPGPVSSHDSSTNGLINAWKKLAE
jgi:glucose-6-phosphate isomerase